MNYKIIYTTDYNETQNAAIISARDYTGAYLTFIYTQPLNVIILDISEDPKQ